MTAFLEAIDAELEKRQEDVKKLQELRDSTADLERNHPGILDDLMRDVLAGKISGREAA